MVCSGSDNNACNRIAWQMPSGCPAVVPPVIDVLDLCSLPPLPDTSMAEPPLVVPVPEIPGPEVVTCIHVDPKVNISIGKTDEHHTRSSFNQTEDDCAVGLYELNIDALLPCPVEINEDQRPITNNGGQDGIKFRGNVALDGEECALNGVDMDLAIDCPLNLPKSAQAVSKNGLPAAVEFRANKGNGCEIGDLDLHIAVPCPINMSMPSMVHISMYMIRLNKEVPAKKPAASGVLKMHLAKECKLITLHRPTKKPRGSVVDRFSVFTVCDTTCGFSGISMKLIVPPGCSDTNYNATASAKYNAKPEVIKKLQPVKLAVNIGHSRKTIEESAALPAGNTTTKGKTSETASPSCLFSVGLNLELPPIFSCPFGDNTIRFSVHGPYKIEKSSVKKYSSDASCAIEFLFSGPNGECPLGTLSFTAPGRYGKMGFKLIKKYSKTDEGKCAARFRFTGPSIHNTVIKKGEGVKDIKETKVPYTPTAEKMSDPGGGVDTIEYTIDMACPLDRLSIATKGIASVTRSTRTGSSCADKFEIDVPCPYDKLSIIDIGPVKIVDRTINTVGDCRQQFTLNVPCMLDTLSVVSNVESLLRVTRTANTDDRCKAQFELDPVCQLDALSIPTTNTISVNKQKNGCNLVFTLSVKSDNLEFHDISGAGMAKVYKKGDPFQWVVSVPEMSVEGLTGDKKLVADIIVKEDGLYKKKATAGYTTGLLKTWDEDTDESAEKFVDFKEWSEGGETCIPLITNTNIETATGHENGGTKVTIKNCDGSTDREFYVWNGNHGKDGEDGHVINLSWDYIFNDSEHPNGGIKYTFYYGPYGSERSTTFTVWNGNSPGVGIDKYVDIVSELYFENSTFFKKTMTLTFTKGVLTNVTNENTGSLIGTAECPSV